MALFSFRFLLIIIAFILLYLVISVYVLRTIEQPIDNTVSTADINLVPLDGITEDYKVDVYKHCGPLNITNTFVSCIKTLQSMLSVNDTIITNSCHNVAISKPDFSFFEDFMILNPSLFFEINCIVKTNDILISIHVKYKNELILAMYEYLVYRQYSSSAITYYGVNEQIWIDFNRRCLNRYFGSTLQIFHAEFAHSLTDPPQRYNPVIPHWIHVDEIWCNNTNKWNCYFLPCFDTKLHELVDKFNRFKDTANIETLLEEWRNTFERVFRRMHLVSFLIRPNIKFESILFELNKKLKHWNFDQEKCVAVHLRYGDKITECHIYREGCEFEIGIDEYLQQALIILKRIDANIVFIMTDDESKCIVDNDERLKAEYRHLRFYCISGKGQLLANFGEEIVENVKDKTLEFALMYLSFRWAKHCQGFVGNFDSNVASLTYMFMCDHNGKCPYHYSFDKAHLKHPRLTWG